MTVYILHQGAYLSNTFSFEFSCLIYYLSICSSPSYLSLFVLFPTIFHFWTLLEDLTVGASQSAPWFSSQDTDQEVGQFKGRLNRKMLPERKKIPQSTREYPQSLCFLTGNGVMFSEAWRHENKTAFAQDVRDMWTESIVFHQKCLRNLT